MVKISVVIPVYNTEEFIEDSIKSVLEQTYEDLEVIIVDDNSNESCKSKINTISQLDERIKVYHLSQTQGVGYARNYGMRHATGDYIYFLDSDDYIPYKTLQLLAENAGSFDMVFGRIKSTHFNNAIAMILEGLPKVKAFIGNSFDLVNKRAPLIVNCLIKKQFIEEESLLFFEEAKIFSELTFVIPALSRAGSVGFLKEAIYFKRKRNDPVTNPSLTQLDENIKIENFLLVYNLLKEEYKDNVEINAYIDKLLLNYYRKNIVSHFKKEPILQSVYEQLTESVNKISQGSLNKQDYILKKEINELKRKDIKKYKKVNDRHNLFRDIKHGIKTKKRFYILLYRRLFSKLRMQDNLVFMESFLGKSYSDSPKYIYEYMLSNKMDYKFVWSVQERKEIPGNPIQVKRFSLRYFYYLARAKYWVSNSRLPKYLDKREGNVYLQTWHGTPLKTLVFDIKDIFSADPNYKINFYNQSRRWDYLSSPNHYSSEIFERAFKYNKTMLEYGYPRNDILYQRNNESDISVIKKRLNIPLDKKVILYAPTWRDDEFFARGRYKFTLKLELDKLQSQLGDDYIVLLRTHYFIANEIDVTEYKGFVYDFSLFDDIAELYLVSDILITDYSSVFFDYANLKRPILFYTYDIEKYRDQLRGFYISMESEVPGPLLMTTEEVIDAIQNIDEMQLNYKSKYDKFYNKYCHWDNGQASEKTVKTVFEK